MSKKTKNIVTMATAIALTSNIIVGGTPIVADAGTLQVSSENDSVEASSSVYVNNSPEYRSVMELVENGQDVSSQIYVSANNISCKAKLLGSYNGKKYIQIDSFNSTVKEIPAEIVCLSQDGKTSATYKVAAITSAACNQVINATSSHQLTIPEGVCTVINDSEGISDLASAVTFPSSMERVPENFLNGKSNIKTITFKGNTAAIEDGAFAGTGISNITLPNGFKLGEGVFRGCASLRKVTLPSEITSIPKDTFRGCSSMTSIVLPQKVTGIGKGAFANSNINYTIINGVHKTDCLDLSNIASIGASAFDGCKNLNSVVCGTSLRYVGDNAFSTSSLKSISIPENAIIEKFGTRAFANSNLTSFDVPDNVLSLSSNCFFGCRELTTINFSENFNTLYESVFNGCSKLSKIDLPKTLVKMSNDAFNNAGTEAAVAGEEAGIDLTLRSLPKYTDYAGNEQYSHFKGIKSLTIVNDEGATPITELPNGIFSDNSNLKSVVLNEGLETIGDNAFSNCKSLNNISLSSTVKKIGNNAFKDDIELTSVSQVAAKREDNTEFYRLATIGDGAFNNCSKLKNINLTEGITSIGSDAFNSCALEKLTVPATVKTLGNSALANNAALTDVILTNGLESIGDYCFENDANLKLSVVVDGKVQEGNYIPGTVKSIGIDPFKGANVPDYFSDNCEFKILDKADGTEYGKDEKKNIVIKKYFGTNATADFSVLENDYIIAAISDGAFANNTQVTEAVIPDTVTELGNRLFENCTALENVSISSAVAELKENTFKGCTNLKNVTFQTKSVDIKDLSEEDYNKYVKMDEKGNPKFNTFTIGTRVIDAGAFDGCSKLERIYFPSTLEIIKTGAVKECPLLHSVTFATSSNEYEQNFKTIETEAFSNCPILGYSTTDVKEDSVRYPIILPDSVTVADKAFPAETILQNKGFQYQLTDAGADIVKCYGYNYTSVEGSVDATQSELTKIITVPAALNGRAIGYIGKDAFNNGSANSVTESIILSEGIKGIKGHAFYGCGKLTNVQLCTTLESIEDYAFGGTKLKNVNLPTGVTGVSTRAFKDSAIESITSGNYTYKLLFTGAVNDEFQGVEIIGHSGGQDASVTVPATLNGFKVAGVGTGAFINDSVLTSLTLSDGITYLADGAVNGCKNLSSFSNANTCSVSPNAFIKTAITTHYDNGIEYKIIGDQNKTILITKYTGTNTILNIPKDYDGVPVTAIASGAFANCTNLVSVNMEEGITTIGDNAFSGCTLLSSVAIPYTVTSIGKGAFSSCIQLQTLVLPNLSSISDNMFKGCTKLQTITLPNVSIIGVDAFNGCTKLSGVTIPTSVKVIGKGAFVGTGVGTIAIPHEEGVITLDGAFNEGTVINYKKTIQQFTVVFKDFDGRILTTQIVNSGDSAVEPSNKPTREGYTFKGWDKAFSNITANTEVTAIYEEKQAEVKEYVVTFKNWDGTIIKSVKVAPGATVTAPEEPTREGYTFAGWGKDLTNVNSNMEVVANFNPNTGDVASALPLVGSLVTALAGVLGFKKKRK